VDGMALYFDREYNASQDFSITAVYEKLTPEQVAMETATGKGVNFVEGMTWEQVKAKAKKENKYIFVDCYATWCVPCKVMDKYVYPLNMVGDALNGQFISVKVQMDSTKNDAPYIKQLYPLARILENEYNITALPTYMIFSPNGQAVHKFIGQHKAQRFIELISDAKIQDKQLYSLFNKVKDKKTSYSEYLPIAKRLKEEFGETELALQVARIYIDNYLNKLSEKELLKREHLDFAGQYNKAIRPEDKLFKVIYKYEHLADSIKESKPINGWMNSWAYSIINIILNREIIQAKLDEAKQNNISPNWKLIDIELSKIVDIERAKSMRMDAQLPWLGGFGKRDWAEYLKIALQRVAQKDSSYIHPNELDNFSRAVFKYSNDNSLLNQALQWSEKATEIGKDIDFWGVLWKEEKANILYRLGRREEAIALYKECILKMDNESFLVRMIESLNRILKNEAFWEKY
jgi:thiol-disulfide isomerase/thioredoxin